MMRSGGNLRRKGVRAGLSGIGLDDARAGRSSEACVRRPVPHHRWRGNGSRVGRRRSPRRWRTIHGRSISPLSAARALMKGKLNGDTAGMIFEDERAPADQLGFVLHLGDFIYEVVEYPDEAADVQRPHDLRSRRIPDGGQTGKLHYPLTVDGYRVVYKGYLADPDLQDARARWPFVAIWQIMNSPGQGRQSIVQAGGVPQPGQTVKVAANQAWFEYIPARVKAPSGSLYMFGSNATERRTGNRAIATYRRNCTVPIGRPIANTQIYILDPRCSRSPSASPASSTSAATAWPAATSTDPPSPPNASSPTRSEDDPAHGSTAPATSPDGGPTARSSASDGSTTRSRSAATASSSARSRTPWTSIRMFRPPSPTEQRKKTSPIA